VKVIMKRPLTALLLLAGCAAPLVPPVPPAEDPYASYREAAAAGTAVYRIDPPASRITVVVRSGGPFAKLGHHHAIAASKISGYAAPAQGRSDFAFRLDEMTVDERAVRAQAGLTGSVPADAVAATRANMLGRVLEAGRYPLVQLRVTGNQHTPRLSITLHGVTRSIDVPTALQVTPDTLTAAGQFTLRQTDFGITPMSVLGGALVVKDEMELQFRIQATRVR
jgi:polyisoprenoid-binding protein YceI